jgi:hypothetical protein
MLIFIEDLDKKTVVAERLFLINQLEQIESHFQGDHLPIRNSEEINEHSYKHYHALKIYLLLTCFDILGQPDEWLDFHSWLKSKKIIHIEERTSILSRCPSIDLVENISLVYSEYNIIYGVRNSFFRFIRKIISPEDRKKLMESIKVSAIAPALFTDGITRDSLCDYDADDLFKEKFLFNARNSFTHTGISYGNSARGVFKDFGNSVQWPGEDRIVHCIIPIASEMRNGKPYQFGVVGWPNLLVEIVNNALSTL